MGCRMSFCLVKHLRRYAGALIWLFPLLLQAGGPRPCANATQTHCGVCGLCVDSSTPGEGRICQERVGPLSLDAGAILGNVSSYNGVLCTTCK